MISAIFVRSGGPSAAASIIDSRKYGGPIAAGVTTQSAFASLFPLLSNRCYVRGASAMRESCGYVAR